MRHNLQKYNDNLIASTHHLYVDKRKINIKIKIRQLYYKENDYVIIITVQKYCSSKINQINCYFTG